MDNAGYPQWPSSNCTQFKEHSRETFSSHPDVALLLVAVGAQMLTFIGLDSLVDTTDTLIGFALFLASVSDKDDERQ
ncbi:hypothetical protein ACQQ64_10575 [Corynebacterium diphtheriae]